MSVVSALIALFAVMLAICPVPASGNTLNYRALLVGVSEYPELKKDLWLEGPRNDVMRMREVLVARGVPAQNITTLADGVPGAELPTRRRILDELERLANTARRDDYIILLMGGHGSQQPVPAGNPYAGDEPDGLFEVFLPRDVRNWGNKASGTEGEIPNAILDHEIRALVDRMTASGAFVWAIFDACHSATLVRSAGNPEIRLRQVTPADLGIPGEALDRSIARAAAASQRGTPVASRVRASRPGEGGSAFFYAAQTHEPTPEMRLPAGAPDRRSHGLFSYTIIQALDGGAGMTYQQLAQQVLTRYGSLSEARATPLFTGTALQSGLLGQAVSAVRQWSLNADGAQLSIRAGVLSEIREGAILAILPSAVAKSEQAIGYVQVVKAELATASLTPVAYGSHPVRAPADLRAGKFARLVQPALTFEFAVAADLRRCSDPCPFQPALDRLKSATAGSLNAQVRWVELGQTANLRLVANGRRLWFAPPSMSGSDWCPDPVRRQACVSNLEKSIAYLDATEAASTEGVTEQLGPMLHAASRASNLMRIASALSTGTTASQLKLTVQHVPLSGRAVTLNSANPPKLKPGDRVRVTMKNTGATPVDVTLLYIDSKYGISVMYPDNGASNRLEKGASLQLGDMEINDSTLGTERLAVIVAEASRGKESADYSFLAQATLESRQVTRGRGQGSDPSSDVRDNLFADAGFARFVTRGAGQPARPPANTGMQVLTWQVIAER